MIEKTKKRELQKEEQKKKKEMMEKKKEMAEKKKAERKQKGDEKRQPKPRSKKKQLQEPDEYFECPECKEIYGNDDETWVECESCKEWYHFKCTELKLETTKTTDNIDFVCKSSYQFLSRVLHTCTNAAHTYSHDFILCCSIFLRFLYNRPATASSVR